jgi:hypothetical protein
MAAKPTLVLKKPKLVAEMPPQSPGKRRLASRT